MSKYKQHIFICTNKRPDSDERGSCSDKGASDIRDYFKKTLYERGHKGKVRANQAGCLDACSFGTAVVIYPEAVWYSLRSESDVLEIIEKHIEQGEIVTRLLIPRSWACPSSSLKQVE